MFPVLLKIGLVLLAFLIVVMRILKMNPFHPFRRPLKKRSYIIYNNNIKSGADKNR
jgi:hypothetical protein